MDFALFAVTVFVQLGVMYLLLCIGDFGLQTSWLAMEKGKSREVLFYHAMTANAPIVLLWALPDMQLSLLPGLDIALSFNLTVLAIVIRVISHMVIDDLKARYGLIKTVKMDQASHIAVDLGLILVGLV